jgi:hypothetical protein
MRSTETNLFCVVDTPVTPKPVLTPELVGNPCPGRVLGMIQNFF